MTSSAIPTLYRGVEFRSRLEARWAAFFDLAGWRWAYEPVDLAGWIPDFVISGPVCLNPVPVRTVDRIDDRPLMVEVKPAESVDDFAEAIARAERALRDPGAGRWAERDVLLLGSDPDLTDGAATYGASPIGILGELWTPACSAGPTLITDIAVACEYTPGVLGVRANIQSYTDRITGFYLGGHTPAPQWPVVRSIWDQAGNVTRWRRPAKFVRGAP